MRSFGPKYGLILPATAWAIDVVVGYFNNAAALNSLARFVCVAAWTTINVVPLYLAHSFETEVTQAAMSYSVVLEKIVSTVALCLFWFIIGVAIDGSAQFKRAKQNGALISAPRWRWVTISLLATAVIFILIQSSLAFWQSQHPEGVSILDRRYQIWYSVAAVSYSLWAIALAFCALRNVDYSTAIARALMRARPEASWKAYVLVTAVATLLASAELSSLGLLILAILQLAYRTLAGWVALTAWCVCYGTLALLRASLGGIEPAYNVIFIASGFLPVVALLYWRPRQLMT